MKNIFSIWKAKGDDDASSRGTSVKVADHSTANISLAAQMLYDCVHSTLSNGAALRGDDMSGFTSLLEALDSKPPTDLNQWRYAQETTGFVVVLLEYIEHPEFIEICNQRNLGEALINALRLLRMLEIKQGGVSKKKTDPSTADPVSYSASHNICRLFRKLCTSIQTVEAMRPVLTKLFCLPLQTFPVSGIHLQKHIAGVIGTLCKHALSSQIIWFLHDSQAVKFMVRSLQELVAIESAPPAANQPKPTTLKGLAAEEKEIWLVAFESIATVLSSSYQFSSVLLGDLEAAGGVPVFVHVVVNTRADRCMKVVSTLFDLLLGEVESKDMTSSGSKSSESSKIAPIFKGILLAILNCEKCIQGDETVEILMETSSAVLNKYVDVWGKYEGENILQSLAFGFLTLCSNDINTYVMLEQSHHIFASIVLCLPSFRKFESLVAVTKTLVFVGGEGRPSFEILSFCAAVAVMLRNSTLMLDRCGDAPKVSIDELSYVLSVFDEVLNGDRKHSLIFSCCGLKYMVCEPIQSLLKGEQSTSGASSDIPNMPIFLQLIKIICTTLKQNSFSVIPEIRNSAVLDLFVDVMHAMRFKSDDAMKFLEVHVAILLSEQDVELPYVLTNICDLVLRLLQQYSYARIACVLRRLEFAFSTISATSHCFAVQKAWQGAKGFECLMSVIVSMNNIFPNEMDAAQSDKQEQDIASLNTEPAGSKNLLSLKSQVACIRCVFALFSVCLTNPIESYMFSYQNKMNRSYLKDKIGYSKVATALKDSGVLLSAYVEDIMNDALSMVVGPSGSRNGDLSAHISNPEGMVVIIDMILHLRVDLAKVAIDLIEQTASGQIDGCQVLVEAGITRHILNTFSSVISDSTHALRDNMLQLLLKLCSEHLILGDFASILRNLVRPELIVSTENRLLLPPWQCIDTSGVLEVRSWYSLRLLNNLLKRTIRQQGTSFVSIGAEASYKSGKTSHLSVPWSDTVMGKPFPVHGLTTSTWFQIEERAAMKQRFDSSGAESTNKKPTRHGSLLPLLAFVSSSMGVYFEVHVDVLLSSGRVIYRRNKCIGLAQFKVPYISEGDWHLFNVSLKRSKRLMATKTHIVVSLDGQIIFSDSVDMEVPSSGSVEMTIGKKIYGLMSPSASNDDTTNMWNVAGAESTVLDDLSVAASSPQLPIGLWRLGTFCLFEEALAQNQIFRIVSKGPSYHGNFQGESPLVDLLPTFATTTLCKCNASLLDLGTQLDAVSMKAVELVVVPTLDADDGSRLSSSQVDIPCLPAPTLVYSGVSFVKNHSLTMISPSSTSGRSNLTPAPSPMSKIQTGMTRKRASGTHSMDPKRGSTFDASGGVESYNTGQPRLALNNLAVDTSSLPQAELVNGYHVSRIESMSRCVAAMGGPSALMPFVQAASTESQLIMALSLVRNSSRNDPVNLKYMQTGGYQLLSFLLTLKPKRLITEAVVESLFSFAVDKGSHLQPEKLSKANDFRTLLVDTQALYHLILNHQVWGADRYIISYAVVDLLRGLVSEDAHHSALNAKRLSLLGVSRWLMLLMVYGVNKSARKSDLRGPGKSSTPPQDVSSKAQSRDSLATDQESRVLEENGDSVWNISCRSSDEMACRRDASDPFLVLCLAVVRPILLSRLRGKDLEFMGQLVTNSLYSVDDVNSVAERSGNNTTIDRREHRMFTSTNINVGPALTNSKSSEHADEKYTDESIDSLFPPSVIKMSSQLSFQGVSQDSDSLTPSRNNELTPIAMMRVALVRFIRELYICKIEHVPEAMLSGLSSRMSTYAESVESKAAEDATVKLVFGKTLTPVWFLSAIVKSADFSVTAEILRLLFMHMQHDTQFCRSFCAADGMNVLLKLFTDEPVHIAIVLPIVGLFFNIPMSKLPLPLQGCELSVSQLIGTNDGPSVSSPEVSDVFIPAFDILMCQFSAHARYKAASGSAQGGKHVAGSPNEMIRHVILHAMSNCPLLREFMQFRIAINSTVLALLRCSDAMDDFGTRVYVQDLCSAINDNYLDVAGGEVRSRATNRDDSKAGGEAKSSALFSDNTDKINLILPEGTCMLNIIRGIIADSIKFFQNPQSISFLLLAFPRLVSDLYVSELHKLVVSQLAVVSKSLYVEVNLDYISVIAKIFSFIVPIAKARLLQEDVLLEILQLIFVLLDMLCFMKNNFTEDEEKFLLVHKEFVGSARYFSVILLSSMRSLDPDGPSNLIKSAVLQLVRSHLQVLFDVLDEDMPLPLKARTHAPDTVVKGVPVLESFQLSIIGSEQANRSILATARSKRMALFNTTMSLVQTEVAKVANLFSAHMFCLLHPLFLDDNYSIRVEALRIVAGLFYFRRSIMTSLLLLQCKDGSTESASTGGDSSEAEVGAIDGYLKLLPANPQVLQIATKLFSGATVQQQREVDDGEDSRFADFMYWLSSTSYRHDLLLCSLDNCLSGSLPSLSMVSDVLKLIQGNTVLTEISDVNNNDDSGSAQNMTYASPALRSIRHIYNEMVQWSLYGIADSAAGAKLWNGGWMALQCSPIWGALPLSSSDNIAPPGSSRIGWRLGSLEGPEKIRARMEEDFGTSLADCCPIATGGNIVPVAVEKPGLGMIEDAKEGDIAEAGTPSSSTEEGNTDDPGTIPDSNLSDSAVIPETNFQDILKQIKKSGGLRKQHSFASNQGSGDRGGSFDASMPLSPCSAVDADEVDTADFFAEENSMSVEFNADGQSHDGSPFPLSPGVAVSSEVTEFRTPPANPGGRYSFGAEDGSTEYEHLYDAMEGDIETLSPVQVSRTSDVLFDDGADGEDNSEELKEENEGSSNEDPDESPPDASSDPDDDSGGGESSGSARFDRFRDGVVTRMSSLRSDIGSPSLKDINRKIAIRFSSSALAGVLSSPDSNSSLRNSVKRESMTLRRRVSGADLPENASMLSDSVNNSVTLSPSFGVPNSADKNPYEMEESSRKFHLLNEIMKGLIGVHEWVTGQTLNVDRIFGLESHPALLVLTPRYVHLLDGFQLIQSAGSADKLIEWTSLTGRTNVTTSFRSPTINSPRQNKSDLNSTEDELTWVTGGTEEVSWLQQIWKQFLRDDIGYFRISVDEIYTLFRRRYQLQDKALEITDTKGFSLLFACKSRQECDGLLKKLLETDMSNSMFRIAGLNNIQLGVGLFSYRRVIAYYVSYVQKLWLKGSMSNFEYLMHLNTAAGRSFQDLTQYPVFPWILSDYTSSELDLNNSNSFRDLTKPMGAQGEKRAEQYKERFKTMHELLLDQQEDALYGESFGDHDDVTSTPPFFYGTHYSCAGYVLHYLMRMQPFSGMAINLQGGQFDKPDRLFRSIGQSWLSASRDNLQDVRELVPEFFFLPDFLTNSNKFELGVTQRGEKIDDIILPPWANNSPAEFIKKHREALESRYVSENIHHWIDLIFGYKQLGAEAEKAMNVFIHLTYEGEVDVDTIQDPVMRDATIAQINNFGQTPTRLFQKPHPKKTIPTMWKPNPQVEGQLVIDSDAVNYLLPMSPPFSVVGAPHLTDICKVYFGQSTFPPQMSNKSVGPIGDIRVIGRDKVLAVPSGCFLMPSKYSKYIRFWRPSGSISVHPSQPPIRLDPDRDIETHDSLHSRPVSCVAVSSDGALIATGSEDRSVRLWAVPRPGSMSKRLHHVTTFSGHSGSILCLDISIKLSIIVSGSADKTAMIWDIHHMKLLHVLSNFQSPVISVSINQLNGNIAVLSNDRLTLFGINGHTVASMSLNDAPLPDKALTVPYNTPGGEKSSYPSYTTALKAKPRVVVAPSCADWQDGVVAVTGHEGGYIFLWKVITEGTRGGIRRGDKNLKKSGVLRKILVPFGTLRTHRADISVIKLCHWNVPKLKPLIPRQYEGENGLEMLVGDIDGYVSRWDSARIDQMSQSEITSLTARHQSVVSLFSSVMLAPEIRAVDDTENDSGGAEGSVDDD